VACDNNGYFVGYGDVLNDDECALIRRDGDNTQRELKSKGISVQRASKSIELSESAEFLDLCTDASTKALERLRPTASLKAFSIQINRLAGSASGLIPRAPFETADFEPAERCARPLVNFALASNFLTDDPSQVVPRFNYHSGHPLEKLRKISAPNNDVEARRFFICLLEFGLGNERLLWARELAPPEHAPNIKLEALTAAERLTSRALVATPRALSVSSASALFGLATCAPATSSATGAPLGAPAPCAAAGAFTSAPASNVVPGVEASAVIGALSSDKT
jgi:hypothetical protein